MTPCEMAFQQQMQEDTIGHRDNMLISGYTSGSAAARM